MPVHTTRCHVFHPTIPELHRYLTKVLKHYVDRILRHVLLIKNKVGYRWLNAILFQIGSNLSAVIGGVIHHME